MPGRRSLQKGRNWKRLEFRRLESGFAAFHMREGHSRKDVSLTFDVCTWEEGAELRLVGLFLFFQSQTFWHW